MNAPAPHKIFCIGAPKTGTSSMRQALKKLGYRHKTWDRELWLKYKENDINSVLKVAEQYDSFDDGPWNNDNLYIDLDRRFPGSKFILTERDPEAWIRSHESYFSAVRLRKHPYLLWPRRYNEEKKQRLLRSYSNRNEEVKSYFQYRPDDLLVINVCSGEGWKKLCPFLGHPPVDGPFPRENVTSRKPTTLSVWRTIISNWGSKLKRTVKPVIRHARNV